MSVDGRRVVVKWKVYDKVPAGTKGIVKSVCDGVYTVKLEDGSVAGFFRKDIRIVGKKRRVGSVKSEI